MFIRNKFLNTGTFFLLLAFLLVSADNRYKSGSDDINAKMIVDHLFKSVENIKTLKYNLKLSERIEGKIDGTQSYIKLQVSPRKLYLYMLGPELIWIEGQNNGNALVNPKAFPYFNLNLNPYGSIMRKNQHHTIHEIGFEYMANLMKGIVKKSGDQFEKYFVYAGEEKWNNRTCYKIIISFPEFAYNYYTVLKGEDLVSIARKLKVSEYMILENNPKVKDYYGVKEGDQIKVPNAYAKLTIMLIDKQFMLPVSNKIFDDKGLFESYEYYNLQVNPKIADEEFTKSYKDYSF